MGRKMRRKVERENAEKNEKEKKESNCIRDKTSSNKSLIFTFGAALSCFICRFPSTQKSTKKGIPISQNAMPIYKSEFGHFRDYWKMRTIFFPFSFKRKKKRRNIRVTFIILKWESSFLHYFQFPVFYSSLNIYFEMYGDTHSEGVI